MPTKSKPLVATKPVHETKPRAIVASDGSEITYASVLALTKYTRWTAKRKQVIVEAILGGVVTIDDVVRMIPDSSEKEWQEDIAQFRSRGTFGLKVTMLGKEQQK